MFFKLYLFILIAGLVLSCSNESTTEPTVNVPPTCEITQPSNNGSFSLGDTVEISVNASDPDGQIENVKFYIEGQLKNTDYERPYSYTWDTSEGQHGVHIIRAEAVDDEGGIGASSEVSITVTQSGSTLEEQLQDILDSCIVEFGVMGASVSIIFSDRNMIKLASGYSEPNVPIESDMIFGMASITKTYTATLILLLKEEGLLSLNDSLNKWLPPYQNIDSTITIKQLLNHTTGLYDFTNNPAFWDAIKADSLNKKWTPEEVLNTMVLEPIFPVGTDYSYSNTNYILLGLIIESVTGNTVLQEFKSRLLNPFNIHNTFLLAEEEITGFLVNSYSQFDMNGCRKYQQVFADMVWTCGGLYSTAEDIALFGIELFQGNILQNSTLNEMCDLGTSGYGYGVHLIEDINELVFAYGHDGGGLGFVSRLAYIPEMDAVFVLMTNEITNDNSHGNYLTIITHDMLELLLDQTLVRY